MTTKPFADLAPVDQAIALIDEINERGASRLLNGISASLHRKICKIRAALVRHASAPQGERPSWSRFAHGDPAHVIRTRRSSPRFPGIVIGWYERTDGERGYVLEHRWDGIVHVYPEAAVGAGWIAESTERAA